MSTTNGTFDTDLSGWSNSSPMVDPNFHITYNSVTWDNGKAHLMSADRKNFNPNADMFGCGRVAWLEQTFTIDDTTISFDYSTTLQNCYSTCPSSGHFRWFLTAHVSGTDELGQPIIVDTVIVSGESIPANQIGTVFKDVLSQYIGNTATIRFEIQSLNWTPGTVWTCANTDMLIDNVLLSPNWGTYRVSSVPGGTDISIDDSFVNITPDTDTIDITHIPIGSHTIKISAKTDYYDFSQTDYIYPGRIYNIPATLIPKVACISFYTDPAGAKIYLSDRNGQTLSDTGFTTFKQMCNLFWGDYKWRLDFPGYINESGTTTLTSTWVTVSKTLTPIGIGCIYFNTTPPGARIILDGNDTGQITPYTICDLSLGQHCYDLVLSEYIGESGCVTLTSTQGESVIATLLSCPIVTLSVDQTSVSIGDTIMLTADIQPADAQPVGQYPIIFNANGTQVGTCNTSNGTCTISWDTTRLSAGQYAVTAELGTLSCISTPITVTISQEIGCIYFNTTPPGARIILDGNDTGKTTPNTICDLGLGQHCYDLILSGYIGKSGCITLTSTQGELVTATLSSCPIVTLSVDKTSVFIGDTIMLTADIQPTDIQPVGQYPIIFKINSGQVDSGQVGTCNTSNGTCTISWDTTRLSAGQYAVTAELEPLSCISIPITVTISQRPAQAGFGEPAIILVAGLAVGALIAAKKKEKI